MVEEVEVVETLGNNYHIILEFTILKAGRTKGNQISVLYFKRGNCNKLRKNVGTISWMEMLKGK